MEWISGIGRDSDGRLCVQAQGLDGIAVPANLADASADLNFSKARKQKRTSVTLHARRPGDTRQYLAGLGLEGLGAEGQPVYEFESSIGCLVIPSQVLIFATFGSQLPLRRELLAPLGPEALMTARLQDGRLILEKTPGRNREENIDAPMIRTRLEWLFTYPSARAAWGSIYCNALEGRFDSKPARATAEVLPYGCLVGGKLLVTSLRVQSITPAEEPHEFARGTARSTFVFDTRRLPTYIPGEGRPASGDDSLAGIPWRGEISDAQWASIEAILETFRNSSRPGPRTRIHSVRTLLNIMMMKTHMRLSWSKVPADGKAIESAMTLCYRLKRAGYWAHITSALAQTESSSQA